MLSTYTHVKLLKTMRNIQFTVYTWTRYQKRTPGAEISRNYEFPRIIHSQKHLASVISMETL